MSVDEDGYFSLLWADARPGTCYRFQLDDDSALYPDPASRFQPEGPHGPSQVVDPFAFRWTDTGWKGASLRGQVIYEMHIGTFTEQGDWISASQQLAELHAAGISVVEIMPIAEFAGRFGWGYDGVDLFAPTRLYGHPDEARRFIDLAHRHEMAVILDVVYNHFGPDGCFLSQFSDDYFTDRYSNEWGRAINFDGQNSAPVREFFVTNAAYWIEEFHFDGLRLDATQQIFDSSSEHIVAAIARRVREAARGRSTILVAENERQDSRLVRPVAQGGYGLDALWNDDLHHSAVVALTGHNQAYYTDYRGAPQEFISAAKYGFLYQGQRYKWQKARRGTPSLDLEPAQFVSFMENHDQVANTARGERLYWSAHPGDWRALTAFLLLGPGTPMLFQGQEFRSSKPFLYFADHQPELARQIRQGRIEFLGQFPNLAQREMQSNLADPADPAVFHQCKLDFKEREQNAGWYQLHKDLLRLRRQDAVFSRQRRGGLDGAVLGPHTFVLRYWGERGDDRLLIINLGRDLHFDPAPEPLLAPPWDCRWKLLWSSENPLYGGNGTAPVESEQNWRIPGHAAVALLPQHKESRQDG